MASYNGARFIGEQLRSLAEQERLPDEIVICDDGSSDGTLDIVEEFAVRSPFPLRLHRNEERLGYTANFSRAASLCTSDLVSFCDQDDWWFPEKISVVLQEMERRPEVQLLVNDQVITSTDLRPTDATIFANARKLGCSDSVLAAGCCTTVRRTFLQAAVPFPPEVPYDAWLGELAELLSVKGLIDQPLQYYRRHDDSTTKSVFARTRPTRLAMFRQFRNSDARKGWDGELHNISIFERRIESRQAAIAAIAGAEAVPRALERLAARRRWFSERRKLLDRPRIRRVPRVFRLWRSGFYKHGLGLLSAVRDVVRP